MLPHADDIKAPLLRLDAKILYLHSLNYIPARGPCLRRALLNACLLKIKGTSAPRESNTYRIIDLLPRCLIDLVPCVVARSEVIELYSIHMYAVCTYNRTERSAA